MDALAGHISYAHCGIGEEDVLSGRVTVVTASCDRIDLLANLQPDVDMLMIGCCTCVEHMLSRGHGDGRVYHVCGTKS